MVNRESISISHTPGGRISQLSLPILVNRSFSQLGRTSTICSSANPLASPRSAPHIPSVTIKGGSCSRVISAPIRRPQLAPTVGVNAQRPGYASAGLDETRIHPLVARLEHDRFCLGGRAHRKRYQEE